MFLNIQHRRIIILIFILTSCHFPKYTHSGDVNSRLNFKKGKWLLNKIEAPWKIKNVLTDNATEKFRDLIGYRFSRANEVSGILIPYNIPNNPTKSILRDIKNGTKFDYFIDIRVQSIKDEIRDIIIGSIDSPVENIVQITIRIYDLNLLEKIYSQSVIGNLDIQEDSSDLSFAKGADNLILTGFNKIMKKIKKNSIK